MQTRARVYVLLINLTFLSFARPNVAIAQLPVDTTSANFIDWDLPSFQGPGPCPSAIGAITLAPPTGQPIDPVYYVTRCPGDSPNPANNIAVGVPRTGPVVVQLQPGTPDPSVNVANWTAWNLGEIPTGTPAGIEDLSPTGGIRLSSAGRVFVRGATQLIRLDITQNPARLTRWNDVLVNTDPDSVSDVAIVERGGGYVDVWTTHDTKTVDPTKVPPTTSLVPPGIVQRLTVNNNSNVATITRWPVDGGAGLHYLSGILIFQGKVYFSEGNPVTVGGRGNAIGELNPSTGHVRHFSLTSVGASGPRQLSVDTAGTIWTVTTSGHVVSFKPSGDMAAYLIPGAGVPLSPGPEADPRGVSAAGSVVGFTESGPNGKKVGLLIPNKSPVPVSPWEEDVAPVPSNLTAPPPELVYPDTGSVVPCAPLSPCPKNSPAVHSDLDPLGEFIEATLPDTGDVPLGILRDPFSSVGTFYVAVALGGMNPEGPDHRLSRVTFPVSGTAAGLVTGGGTIDGDTTLTSTNLPVDPDPDAWAPDGGKANFGFNVYRKVANGPVRGNLNYWNKQTGEHIKSDQILTLVINGNTATFSGTCTNNGVPCTFEVNVQDNGNPGRGKDKFNVKYSGLGALIATMNSGTLTGGNIMIHNKP